MKFKQFLNENYSAKLMSYKGLNISINTKRSQGLSHVQDRLNQRSKLSLSDFKAKFQKVIDAIPNKKTSGNYMAILTKSKIKIPFKYNPSRNDVFILTILDINMTSKNTDWEIELNETYFNLYDIRLNENEYKYIEEDQNFIQFFNEDGYQFVEGIECIILTI